MSSFAAQDDALHVLAISLIPGIGPVLVKQLVAYLGSAAEVFQGTRRHLEKVPGIGPSLIDSILAHRGWAREHAEKELEQLNAFGGFALSYLHTDYPRRLKQIPDSPPVLFGKGKFRFNADRCLAIVGTRKATPYGRQAVQEFLEQLVPYQPVIVSGLAYGIDICAHKAALQLGLETWGVMATGIDAIYPAVHKQTALSMQQNGGILTENSLGTKPDAPRFPARNRIIAGLCDAVWVVEAMEKGGALITARLAQDYNREVFALPGNIHADTSKGCHNLIRNSVASIAASGGDIATLLGWDLPSGVKAKVRIRNYEEANPEERSVLELLQQQGEMHMDELAWQTRISIHQLASILLNLEFQGWVKSLPGKKFGLT